MTENFWVAKLRLVRPAIGIRTRSTKSYITTADEAWGGGGESPTC